MSSTRPLLLVAGMAEGLGVSIASVFAAAGYDVLGAARTIKAEADARCEVARAGGSYTHLTCDLTRPADAAVAFEPYASRVAVAIHNAHKLLIKPFGQIDEGEFEEIWRVTCLTAMTVSRIVLPGMAAVGRGSIVLQGATASLRGGPGFSAFASAKFALRGLAQALSREFGPSGVHVAHVILDSLIDEPQTNIRFGPAK